MIENKNISPMMQQFFQLKKDNEGFIILFRLGDFYEFFEQDAELVAPLLGITLTQRQGHPMAGFPHHSKNGYLEKLIKHNLKIAICDQIETSMGNKKIFERQVTELITPGTYINPDIDIEMSSYLMCITQEKNFFATVVLEASTGDIIISEMLSNEDFLVSSLEKYKPREIIATQIVLTHFEFCLENYYTTPLENSYFDLNKNTQFLKRHFQVDTLSFFEFNDSIVINACAVALIYLKNHLKKEISHVKNLHFTRESKHQYLSHSTIKHLEILEPMHKSHINSSLYYQLNHTKTAMGARFLKYSMINPLLNIQEIQERLLIVNHLKKELGILDKIRQLLKTIPDLERLFTKISLKNAHPGEVWKFYLGLETCEHLKNLISSDATLSQVSFLPHLTMTPLIQKIASYLIPDPPPYFGEKSVILDHFSEELDLLRKKALNSYALLLDIEKEEQEKTGNPKLKLKYNKILGYYFEVTKINSDKIPSYFIRKQSLVNVERFTIEALINFENEVLESKENLIKLEKDLFEELCQYITSQIDIMKNFSLFVKNIDLLACFAHKAIENHYTMPIMKPRGELLIEKGRHPVIENFVEHFISNSIHLDDSNNRILVITGPNMAGKSTFLRQTALIVIMAHCGSFVPAEKTEIPITDAVFTRIGAWDNLAKGESTFLIEMSETAHILRNSTFQSLIVMDEVGRGTSTKDGLALVWAILEYLAQKESKGKVLFSTHHHELSNIAHHNSHIKNYKVAINEHKEKVIFLHKVEPGIADKSYGIYVAQIAGIPKSVIIRAQQLIKDLENPVIEDFNASPPTPHYLASEANSSHYEKEVVTKLKDIAINSLTPLEALQILSSLQKDLKKNEKILKESTTNLFL